MHTQKRIGAGTYTLETKAGLLEVGVQEDGEVYLSQALPQFYDKVDRNKIAASLGISPAELEDEIPVQIVSTGLPDIQIPVKSLDILERIIPDHKRIAEICAEHRVIGYHVFTTATLSGAAAECRNFAPLYDIPEESATGTSNGALLCYLYHHGRISAADAQNVIFKI